MIYWNEYLTVSLRNQWRYWFRKNKWDSVYYESNNKTHSFFLLSPPIQIEQLFDAWIYLKETQKGDTFSLQVKKIDHVGRGWKGTVWHFAKSHSLEAQCLNFSSQLIINFQAQFQIKFILLMSYILCLSFHLLTLFMLHLIISLLWNLYSVTSRRFIIIMFLISRQEKSLKS